jgi:D-beta-D-heptose 7-phosphate kinase/D-beta-D-heptose 1-phosphate adenosyltransferase
MLIDKKIISVSKAQEIVKTIVKERQKVVFTNGCFDILHVGHLQLLQKAKSFGDVLIVGLNSDRSVKKLKGPARPILPQRDRARLLAALEMVDYVVIFDEDTPYELLSRIKPQILVKGGDYTFHEIVGRDIVQEVKTVPLLRAKSSSRIIAAIRSDKEQTT